MGNQLSARAGWHVALGSRHKPYSQIRKQPAEHSQDFLGHNSFLNKSFFLLVHLRPDGEVYIKQVCNYKILTGKKVLRGLKGQDVQWKFTSINFELFPNGVLVWLCWWGYKYYSYCPQNRFKMGIAPLAEPVCHEHGYLTTATTEIEYITYE